LSRVNGLFVTRWVIFNLRTGCPAPPPMTLYRNFSQNCSTELSLDYDALQTCATGENGHALVLAAAKATVPYHHTYVPWLVINGEHNPLAEKGPKAFISEVCKAYTDPASLPPVCTGSYTTTQTHTTHKNVRAHTHTHTAQRHGASRTRYSAEISV